MHPLLIASCAVAGLVAGDAMEVVVEHLGSARSVVFPWTSCESCGTAFPAAGRVPLLRVIERRHPCRTCGHIQSHPWRPLVMGLVSGALLAAFAARFGFDIVLLPMCVLGVALVAISAVDLERLIIPNRILYPTLAMVFPMLVLSSAVDGRWGSLLRAVIAGAAAFALFFAVHLALPRGMGFGDVRLAGLIGLSVGWLGLGHAFIAFFASFLFGALVGVVIGVVTGGGRKTKIPFGPFLAAGAVFSILFGSPIASALFHRG